MKWIVLYIIIELDYNLNPCAVLIWHKQRKQQYYTYQHKQFTNFMLRFLTAHDYLPSAKWAVYELRLFRSASINQKPIHLIILAKNAISYSPLPTEANIQIFSHENTKSFISLVGWNISRPNLIIQRKVDCWSKVQREINVYPTYIRGKISISNTTD